jgi:ribosomal protein S18 acetylase RimI-like enzyme
MDIKIREYHPNDLEDIYNICLLTGKSGKDAGDLFNYPKLLGEYFAAPYVTHEPELCFVAVVNDKPVGYILGTIDSSKFSEWCENNWFPELREKYVLDDEYKSPFEKRIVELIHTGYFPKKELADYPAHLHIDILPVAQGKGVGRRLINAFLDKLKELDVSAVHLEVGKNNLNAIEFYKRLGFEVICEYEHSIAFGKWMER